MAPKVSEDYLEARRQQILDAAVRCFSRRGLHLATLEHIRMEAGLSRGAVYHYFKSKEDIIDAIRSRSAEDNAAIFAEAEAEESPEEKLVRLAGATYRRMVRPESADANRLSGFLSADAMLNQRMWEGQMESIRPFMELIEGIVRQGQELGQFNPALDPAYVARVIIGAFIGFTTQMGWEPDLNAEQGGRVLEAMLTGHFREGQSLPEDALIEPEARST